MNSILFVDDDPLQRRAFCRLFSGPDYQIDTAEDGVTALAMLERGDHDVLISDFTMPEMTGAELLAQAKVLRPQTVRMLVTAQSDFCTAVEAVNRGEVFRLLRKPWEDEELRFSLKLALEMRQLARERTLLEQRLAEKSLAVQRANDELVTLNENLESIIHRRTHNLLDALTAALDMRDNETQLHSRRVSAYAFRLAVEVGLDENDCRTVEQGALLHDVGKIGVPDSVLLKPGKLDEDEWRVMKRHPAIGSDLLSHIDFLEGARQIIVQHQERFDGKGYPRGLAGSDICIGARIFAVVDTYDAITSDRPYRAAQPYEAAAAEIARAAGTQLDPTVTAAFLRLPADVWHEIRDAVAAYALREAA